MLTDQKIAQMLCPHLSIDCVVFGYDQTGLNVLLVKRSLGTQESEGYFEEDWSLTGHHAYEDEKINEAANRIVHQITGLRKIYLEQFKTFASPDRLLDPKDQEWLKYTGMNPKIRVVTIGFFALLATKNVTLKWMGREVHWKPIKEVGKLAFDHNEILKEALVALRNKMKHEPIGFELLPQKFTLSQLQDVYEKIFDSEFDKRNFRKKVGRMKYVIPLNEKQTGVPHKPAQLFTFDREVFDKTNKELFDFII